MSHALSPNIAQFLNRIAGSRIYIDSCVFIYFLEKDAKRFELVQALLLCCTQQHAFAFTGAAAVAEVMVKPYRLGEKTVITQAEAFFTQPRFLSLCEHRLSSFQQAARIAGEQKMKLVDALHYATALENGCTYLITNDRAYASNPLISVIQIDALIE